MAAKATKQIVVPVDGSERAVATLDYLNVLFGPDSSLEVVLFYVLPTLPPILEDEKKKNKEIGRKIKEVEEKNIKLAEQILTDAKIFLLDRGFKENRVKTVYKKKDLGIARDICDWAEMKGVDAVMVSTRGRTRLQSFFMGEVSRYILEYIKSCPVWMVEKKVKKRTVLIAIDNSENALRAVDHAGFMLSGTDVPVILFHSKRKLRRFLPEEIVREAPELEALWKDAAGEQIAPYMGKAKEMLLKAGLSEEQITVKVVDGSRSAVTDILSAAKRYNCGTVVVGRRGVTGMKEIIMGSVTRKILEDFSGKALWIVR